LQPEVRIVVLTGYGNIATAVAAIKHGAVDYLAKPCDGQTIFEVLIGHKEEDPIENLEVMSVDRIKWEHIQRVLLENSHNISQTARALHMHRRTLQRILSKHAPRI
ncbi:MAG TPA: response regulator, partial [Alphaproteobacteria bacterium]|nr:response regulator [Alphaproteobacteria bacterium]